MKSILVCGAGGFIGGDLVKRFREDSCWVRAVDIKQNEHAKSAANEFILGDQHLMSEIIDRPFDEGEWKNPGRLSCQTLL